MKLNVELTPRSNIPTWMAYGTPVFTILAALIVSGFALFSLGVNPLAAYNIMFVQTLTTSFGITNTLVKAVPLIFAGLAVYLPLKARLWNIGAEGQLIIGAIVGTAVGLSVSLPIYALLPLMFITGGIAGAMWIAVPAWLRARYGINEIITTLLFVFIAQSLLNYVVRGPLQAAESNFPQSASLPTAATLPSIPIIGFPSGVLLAIVLVAVTYAIINYTRLGYEITFMGANDNAAEHAGMSKLKIYLIALMAGGAMAGFAGISEMSGVEGRLRASFDPGYGFTAVPIALLGRNGAFRVLLAALFFAVLFIGGSSIETSLGVPSAITNVMEALIILFLITAEFFKNYSVGLSLDQTPTPSAPGDPEGDV